MRLCSVFIATACASYFPHAFIGNSAVLQWSDVCLTGAHGPIDSGDSENAPVRPIRKRASLAILSHLIIGKDFYNSGIVRRSYDLI